MAGFEVIIYGRFWVIAEERNSAAVRVFQGALHGISQEP
jgi:hypothetical protein